MRPSGDATRLFHAETELVGVNADGSFDAKSPLATFTYGWSKANGLLKLTPVTLNGVTWQGSPLLKAPEAAYLCDPGYIAKPDLNNLPLPDALPNPYKGSPTYRFIP